MVNRVRVLDACEEDRQALHSCVQARTASMRHRERAWRVLLAAEGLPAAEVAAQVGCSRPTVTLWRSRYATDGLAGLGAAPRLGAPPELTQARKDETLAATLAPPPESWGSHWSSRLFARHVGDVSQVTVNRLWKPWYLQPCRVETSRFSTDPQLVAKAYPRRQPHLVVDNSSADNRADVTAWLANNRWVQLAFTSDRQVTDAICAFTDAWDDRCVPFVWTRTAEEILTVANREAASGTDH